MNAFETKLTTLLRQYGKNYDMLCQRNIQSRFVTQYADILIDCGTTKQYIGIECKRVKTKNFYFKRYFHQAQLDTLFTYFSKTGRAGFVSIKLNKTISIIPWQAMMMMQS
jgi:Holliday junction resolvase